MAQGPQEYDQKYGFWSYSWIGFGKGPEIEVVSYELVAHSDIKCQKRYLADLMHHTAILWEEWHKNPVSAPEVTQ